MIIINRIKELRSLGMSDDDIADKLFVEGHEGLAIQEAFDKLDAMGRVKPGLRQPKTAAIAGPMPWRLIFVAGLAGFIFFTKAGKKIMKKVVG